MADIRIEKKKTVWPWILLVIILGVLAFLYFYGSTDGDDTQTTEMEEITHTESILILHENEIEIV
tara:strand:+ start:254 stop:448 length:195 start_codon:yes stop_codon:yes gene_type:complete